MGIARGGVCHVPDAACHVAGDGVGRTDEDAVGLEDLHGAGKAHVAVDEVGVDRLALPHVVQAIDGVEGVLEGHAVGGEAHVGLELLHGRLGVRAVEAVDRAAREAEHVERHLQVAHVGTVEVGKAQVERAVTHVIGLVDQHDPGNLVNLVGHGEAVLGTEGAHGGGRRGAERLGDALVFGNGGPQAGEPLLYVLDCRPDESRLDCVHCCLPESD